MYEVQFHLLIIKHWGADRKCDYETGIYFLIGKYTNSKNLIA